MDTTSSVIAALDAGKLPSQRQLNDFIDWLLNNIIPFEQLDNLTHPGAAIARTLADVLDAYKQLGTNKNYDNLVQDTLWHLSEHDFSSAEIQGVHAQAASADMEALRAALRVLVKTLWANISGEGNQLLSDLTAFVRLGLAGVAESVEAQAAHTKQTLRDTESEPHRTERDPRVAFEHSMDTVKSLGSQAIGTGQSVTATAEDSALRVRSRLTDAFNQICDRAQSDDAYKRALSTLFNIASKWLNWTFDAAAAAAETASLDDFIHDPTEEKHLHHALTNIRTLLERIVGNKSLDELFVTLRACALDIQQDADLKAWFDDLIIHVRSGLEVPGYVRSQEAQSKHEQLRRRWDELRDSNSDAAGKWKADLGALRGQLRDFEQELANDADLRRVREAQARFTHVTEEQIVAGGGLGLHYALEQSSWFWQDLFNVYTQRILAVMKNIPIPRIEYVDREVEFVLENLDISSLRLLPGHAYMRNITDIEITAPGTTSVKTAFGTLTHIRLQAIQLSLRDVSFFYKDKQSTVGPSALTGIMQFDLPTQGLDIDFKFRLIPTTEQGLAEREQCKRFFKVERTDVKLSNDITFNIKESNHRVLASVFKPVLVHRFRDAVERTLEAHIKGAFDVVDAISFDVSKRSEVFADTGLGPAASFSAAIWSEMGHLRKREGGVLSGWKATGTGIVHQGGEGEPSIAMGAAPQILSGDKRGPLGYFSQPLAAPGVNVDVPGAVEGATARLREASREAVDRVQTFRESVQMKTAEEKGRSGWESAAFDVV